jgi:hypothetical protein
VEFVSFIEVMIISERNDVFVIVFFLQAWLVHVLFCRDQRKDRSKMDFL